MRAWLLLAFVAVNLPLVVFVPFWGVLLWYWYGFMLPQVFAWGVGAKLGVYIAATTVVSTALVGSDFSLPRGVQVRLLLALWFSYVVSSYFAVDRTLAVARLLDLSKIFMMAGLLMGLARTQERLRALMWVVAGSIGFLGVHGAARFLMSGGDRVKGIGGNFSDNNDLALGINMALPLLWYIREEVSSRVLRGALLVVFGAGVVAVVGTYSRGGFLTLVTVLLFLWAKSSRRLAFVAVAGVVALAASFVIPDRFGERMGTIGNYREDQSALSRILCMNTAYNIFLRHPATGVGLDNMLVVFYDYLPPDADLGLAREPGVAHNTYLQIAAEAGLPAVVIYLTLIARSLRVLNRIEKPGGGASEALVRYARMVQGGIVVAVVGTMFLSRIQLELIYVLFASVAVIERLSVEGSGAPAERA